MINNYFNTTKFNLQFRLHLFLQLYKNGKLYINKNYNKINRLHHDFVKNLKYTKPDKYYFYKQLCILKEIIDLIFENNYENNILHINNEKNNEKLTCILCLEEFKKTCCYNTKPEKVIICNNSFINKKCKTDCNNCNDNSSVQNNQVCQNAVNNHHHVMHLECFINLYKDTLTICKKNNNCKKVKNNNFKKVKTRQCLCCTNSINNSYSHRVIID